MSGSDETLGYDEIPYPSAPYPYSHCDHLAIVGRLFGVETASPARCRVLEIGCADGANLIPMALTLGESRFTGIDLSPRQVAAGQAVIDQLRLSNIELRCEDLAKFAAQGGEFDYIIAHGVFSWTSASVQTSLLELCRSCLAPRGIAFISYNVYPGWGHRTIVRQWLKLATRDCNDTNDGLRRSRQLIVSLGDLLANRGNEEHRAVINDLSRLASWTDGYLRHDLLEDSNEPFYFSDFIDRIEPHGLRFVAEADVASMAGAGLPAKLAGGIQRLAGTREGSLVEREALFDLVTNRAFRQSLLCRAECQPKAQIDVDAVRSAYVVSTLEAARAKNASGGPVRFESRGGFGVDVSDPLAIAALKRLERASPAGHWFRDLIDDATDDQSLSNVILAAFVERAVELHTIEPTATYAIGGFPEASPLARLQAAKGALVTNLRHDVVQLEPAAQELVRLLDGTRHRDSLAGVVSHTTASAGQTQSIDKLLAILSRASLLMKPSA